MKLRILSDLHIEFSDWNPPAVVADVVVLAGDIHVKGKAVEWALERFSQPVVLVPGNHDYYGGSLGYTLNKMRERAAGTNVHLLSDGELVLGDVRFLGSTLWTDYRLTGNEPLAQWDAQQVLSDFKKIRDEQYRKVRPYQMAAKHARSRAFLDSALDEPFAGRTVVVSHHAPCEQSINEHYKATGGHLNAAYASRLDHLMGERVALWVHGHTHDSFDYEVYGTRVVCNPRGYGPSHLNKDFKEEFIIEL